MFDYSRMIVVTNRQLCSGDYLTQLEKVTALHPHALILREKDLSADEYTELAKSVIAICEKNNVPCFLHSHAEKALEIGCKRIHMSVTTMRNNADILCKFNEISVSCHSLADVKEAIAHGAAQVLLGNIFETDCKKGLPGKGLEFLHEVCNASTIPVYAIGGITHDNLVSVIEAGATGGCMMSGFMRMEL